MSYMITQLLNEERVARVRSWLDSTDYWSDGINSMIENNPGDGEVYKSNLELDRGMKVMFNRPRLSTGLLIGV